MKTLRARLQHRLNPLHLYCRLRCAGIRAAWALKVCALYEKSVYRALPL